MVNGTLDPTVAREFAALIDYAKRLAPDVGPEVNALLEDGLARPLQRAEAAAILTRLVERLRSRAGSRGDHQTAASLEGAVEDLVTQALEVRARLLPEDEPGPMVKQQTVFLLPEHNGMRSQPVVPRPVFHEREVPMIGGFIKATDIKLWQENERLEIHTGQFTAKHGRTPTPEELLNIMLGKMPLDGVKKEDEFEILALARSIAANGVRKPPILDIDGTLLDGNRRVAACMLIQYDTKEFTSAEKRRSEYIYVWQLTPHATNDDRQKVIVSLNFESDCKKDWPDYIKARKVADEWQAMLALEGRKSPGPARLADMKRELSKKYALGPDTTVVNRFLKMMRWVNEFEDHHINVRERDLYAVQHAANRYFQYFDEIGKGESAGGVAWSLNQDDQFKRTVFDLLFDGKFENWTKIRELRHIYNSKDARATLAKAHEATDLEQAQSFIDESITIANASRAENRSAGANDQIERFVRWLLNLPPMTFRDTIRIEVLQLLLDALAFIGPMAEQAKRRKEAQP